MAYPDPQFNVAVTQHVVGVPSTAAGQPAPGTLGTVSAVGGGTDTYSAAAGTAANGVFAFRPFMKACKITGVKVLVAVAAGGGVSNQKMFLMNGTNTFGTVTVGATAAGTFCAVTLASDTFGSNGSLTTPCLFTAGGVPSMIVTNTNTATASTLGQYWISFDVAEQFS